MRHFEFHEAGSLGMQLGRGRYPIEIREVDEGTPAHQQGVPPNSVMVRVNGQPLEPNDGEDVREQVKKMLKERPVTFDVVLRDAAGAPPPAGGHPPGMKQPPQAQRLAKGGHLAAPGDDAATPAMGNAGGNAAAGQALASAGRGGAAARAAPGLHGPPRSRAVGVAGATSAGPRAQVHGRAHQVHDAGEGAAARMDCHELIDLQTAEEQETVRRVLRKLHNERHGEYHPVFAGLREMAGHEPFGPGAAAD